jgi:hypothetical protein
MIMFVIETNDDVQGFGHSRKLKNDQTGEFDVTALATPQELQAAVARGSQHIEIVAHLDLSILDIAPSDDADFTADVLKAVPATTKSIRVSLPTQE